MPSLEKICWSNLFPKTYSSHKIIEKLEKKLQQENIKFSQKKDDQKLQEMLIEMSREIKVQKEIEEKQREERKRQVEEDLRLRKESICIP